MSPIVPGQLPAELASLLALHSSFLTALALHYAHNGTASPPDLREITASATGVWRERKVTNDDVRLLIGILDHGPSGRDNPYYLSDYGRGKICIEIKDNSSFQGGVVTFNEEALQNMFREGLDSLWSQWCTSRNIESRPIAVPKRGRGRPKKTESKQTQIQTLLNDESINSFLSELPLAEITISSSLVALAPSQEKGRKRLREIKDSAQQGRLFKKSRQVADKENQPLDTESVQPKITEFAAVRKTHLLDRILAKQEAAKTGPAPPSPAELARRAALQRTPEVMGVLSLLCANRPGMRVSFSTNTILQQIQGSIRTPLSRDEALKCIQVLASEVAPGYVSMVNMGTISSVVVIPSMRPLDIKSRLVALGA